MPYCNQCGKNYPDKESEQCIKCKQYYHTQCSPYNTRYLGVVVCQSCQSQPITCGVWVTHFGKSFQKSARQHIELLEAIQDMNNEINSQNKIFREAMVSQNKLIVEGMASQNELLSKIVTAQKKLWGAVEGLQPAAAGDAATSARVAQLERDVRGLREPFKQLGEQIDRIQTQFVSLQDNLRPK